ncbi:hypothetical protein M5K25_019755 [Dendrobium thyrsiflorum]|uniref:Uncharacterized protein n=1 Tax=Dendrobium thyrsiflorum TaxID=117978 RepID=A0ABD0UGH4_DENTH
MSGLYEAFTDGSGVASLLVNKRISGSEIIILLSTKGDVWAEDLEFGMVKEMDHVDDKDFAWKRSSHPNQEEWMARLPPEKSQRNRPSVVKLWVSGRLAYRIKGEEISIERRMRSTRRRRRRTTWARANGKLVFENRINLNLPAAH